MCAKLLPTDVARDFVTKWYELSTETQSNLIASMYEAPEAPDGTLELQSRTHYYIEDYWMCRPALCALLGIGQDRLKRMMTRVPDLRSVGTKGFERPERQTASFMVDIFFME